MEIKRFVIVLICMLFFIWNGSMTVMAQDDTLIHQYAPILYFEQQETCFPVNVSYHIDNSYLYQVTSEGTELHSVSPTIALLSNYSLEQSQIQDPQNSYLDNQQGTIFDTGIISDYQEKLPQLGYTVYARVSTSGSETIIQYWFFYAFNQGELNQHEGDWEMVQIMLSNNQPTEVMYSQHYAGQKATWNQVEHEGDYIKVYVARGSHANYFRSYSGKVGLSSDVVGSNGKILRPEDYQLVMLESQGWLQFAGRWGWFGESEDQAIETSILGQAGPEGPRYRQSGTMWNNPHEWSSTLLPINDMVLILEWFLTHFVIIFILISILTLGLLFFFIHRRHKKYGLGPRIISMFYIDGLNPKSMGNILCFVGIVIAIFGLFNPWYEVNINMSVPGVQTAGLVDLLLIDGLTGITITLPESTGPVPLGSFILPFSLIIFVGIIFFIFGAVGIAESKKLGRKFIYRGIRLFFPFILIIIVIMALGMIVPNVSPIEGTENIDVSETLGMLSAFPLGGETTINLTDVTGTIFLSWGFGLGIHLLLIAGVIIMIAGGLEIIAKTTFFEQKQLVKKPIEEKK